MPTSARTIRTEDPIKEQWRLLSPFFYPQNVARFLKEGGHENVPVAVTQFVAGSLAQAREYFEASRIAALDISALLLYYGYSNLLAGAATVVSGALLDIRSHGLDVLLPSDQGPIGETQLRAFDPEHGAIPSFEATLGNGVDLCAMDDWPLQDVLAAIPDIQTSFRECYPAGRPYCLPVEVEIADHDSEDGGYTFERIERDEAARLSSPSSAITGAPNYRRSYLPLQTTNTYFILNRRLNWEDLGIYSAIGTKYLPLGHRSRGGRNVALHHFTLYGMALFAMGHISRYHPDRWRPVVQSDETGERQLVEHLLDAGRRMAPNLALSLIRGQRVQFTPGRP